MTPTCRSFCDGFKRNACDAALLLRKAAMVKGHLALRCRAQSKRSGLQCRAPAVRGSRVCRMHGAGSGAPIGNRNALKHGAFRAETLALKREIQTLARMARQTIAEIERDVTKAAARASMSQIIWPPRAVGMARALRLAAISVWRELAPVA